MSKSITHVVFDIGNVLIEWNPEYLYRKLIPDNEERQNFLATVCTPDWNLQQDLGRSWDEAIELASKEHPDKAGLIKAYSERWHDMVPGEIPGTRALLLELKENGVPLYAITNFSSEKFAETRNRFPFLNTSFIDIVVSAEERLLKPDRRIYETLFARNSLDSEVCLFIDDSVANIDGARETGMAGHHFTSAQSLERELADLGLIAR